MASGGKETDGSDEEIIRPAARNKKKSQQLLSSASEEDSDLEIKSKRRAKPICYDSEDTDSFDGKAKDNNVDKRFGSEVLTDLSDNEQSEKCSICLSKFLGQDIATPETCDHVFCLECLTEWSKNVNTCPIDRLKFNLILIRHHKEEKIIRTIFVNNSELPYNSESESNTESQVNYCELCGEDENEGTLLLCHDCQKFYHFGCVIPALNNSYVGSWQCPACDNYIRIGEKFLRDVHRMLQGIRRRFREAHTFNLGRTVPSSIPATVRNQYSSVRELNNRFLYQKSIRRSILSTSESSDEEIEQRTASSRLYQTQIAASSSKSRCALMSTKRRNELISARNRRLVSSAATAATTTNSEDLYAADSDEGYSDFRSSPAPENFDLVGSILQSQSLLHSPEVLKVSRNGSVLQNSKSGLNQNFFSTNASPIHNSGENSRSSSPCSSSSVYNDSMSPFINSAVGKQIPAQSTQNTTSKYSEITHQNYACGSSSAPRERSLSYDECIVSGSAFSSGSNTDRYNNDPNSTIVQKGFCCSSTSDDVKKPTSNKDSKSHHSEEEVDIYSDIESVGEEDNSLSDKLEPPKIAYKCEESQQSDTNDVSDSTDNELVIDEDMPVDEENIKPQESQGFESVKSDDDKQCNNETVNDCEEDIGNDYSNSSFPSNENCDSGKMSDKHSSPSINLDSQNVQNHESISDNEAQESDVDMQEDENSLDSPRKSYPDFESNSCSGISSPKSAIHGDNSNLNVESENLKTTSHSPNINLDNTNDSSHMEYNENNSNISGNNSPVEQPYKHKKYNFSIVNERKCTQNSSENFNDNSHTDPNSNSSFNQDNLSKERVESSEFTASQTENSSHCSFTSAQEDNEKCEQEEGMDSNVSQTENSSHFSFTSTREDIEKCEQEEGLNSNVSQTENSSHFSFTSTQENIEKCEQEGLDSNDSNCEEINLNIESEIVDKVEIEEPMDITDNTQNEPKSNLDFSPKCEQNMDADEMDNLADSNESTHSDNNSHFGSVKQNADGSDMEDLTDSNSAMPQGKGISTVTTETINICNDETVKSDNEYEDCDSLEEASTPCLDENLEGEIENSPPHNDSFENDNQEFTRTSDYEYENEKKEDQGKENNPLSNDAKETDNVDLGIEDISEAGSEDIDEFPEDDDAKDNCSTNHGLADEKHKSDDSNNCFPSRADQDFEDQEEGEIIEEKPIVESNRKVTKRDRYYEDRRDFEERTPRMNISELPRIPKLKRNRDRDVAPEPIPFDTKRNSVLSRIDLGAGDVSWKRLSKHTKERSYRDGRPRDERLLYRERESRNKDRKSSDSLRRNESKNRDRKRDERKKNDRSKSDSRSRKSDKNKEIEWSYSDRDKRRSHKDNKDRHSKEKHSKDRKDRHEKSRYSKDDTNYDREKKDDSRYEREARYDKEDRYERSIYEKGKSKDHKSKRKDRKSESSKSNKEHSHEKHKHTHVTETFLDKQREREVRKIDDKLKIVVEQKEKEKLKSKEKKEKYEKELYQRKHEIERKAYSEMTSIESKEIFTKGDSIIINVNFNRASPKDSSTSNATDTQTGDQNLDELDDDSLIEETKVKSKGSDKSKSSLENASVKRPVTPPERPNQVLSVSESYWKGGDDPDDNNSVTSEKSEENLPLEDENDTMESRDDADNFSSSSSSSDEPTSQLGTKEEIAESEAKSAKSEEIAENISKEETFSSKRRSPRSPSPPSPVDNDSYDPCEPTKSPSPPPIPVAPPLPLSNPKPPPSPELPPLPPEPEPNDSTHEEPHNLQNSSLDFNTSAIAVSSTIQPIPAETQTQSTPAFTGMMLPPPSFLSQTSNSLPNISSLLPPRTLSFSINNTNVMGANHMPPGLGGNYINSQMHAANTLPPPPNPPNISHMTSVPPPPPPPTMGLMSQVRTAPINVQPPLPPNSFLQNLNMSMSIPQLQLPPLPHLPPNLCAALANHQPFTSQNQATTLPCSITNQGSRFMLPPGQIPLIPNQNMTNSNKPHVISIAQMLSHCQTIPVNSVQKSDQPSTPAEKNEVIDMEVDSPYSPGDCSIDSVNDYSPTGSPLPSTPKESGDIFDTLFSADVKTSEKRHNDAVSRNERSKSHSGSKGTGETPSKKSKHEHRMDSKGRHSVRMQIEKNKKARKEQKLAEKLSKLDDSQLKILDELPNSAVEMQVKEKFLKKLNRQERVVEEVKLSLKPYYKSRDVTKEEYKDILRRAVPKICHNKTGEINPIKVKYLVECYVKKAKHSRKKSDKKKSKFS